MTLTPEEQKQAEDIAAIYREKMTPEEQRQIQLEYMALEDSPDGYNAFYEAIYARLPPEHVKGWIEDIYESHEEEVDTLIEAFRGSTKSTTMECFIVKRIAHEPHKTNLIISAGGSDANKIARGIANLIEFSPAFKRIFPHIVKDPAGKWGDDTGYDIWDNRVDHNEWIGQTTAREGRIPTLLGVGYSSTALPGPHPTGVCLIDDYHNEGNTRTDRKAQTAMVIFSETIMPMIDQPDVWFILIGTPWTFKDVIAKTKNRKLIKHIFTPFIEGETWTKKFTPKFIVLMKERIGTAIGWARMMLLDLEATRGMTLKKDWLHYWPHEELLKFGEDWPVLMGVDYTSTEDPTRQVGDYFAIALGKVIPGGRGVVLFDGIREKLPKAEAEDHVIAQVGLYRRLISLGIEAIIQGKEFYADMLNNARLRALGIAPFPIRFNKSKGVRFEKQMAPLFKQSRIYVSDRADSEFIDAFVDEWLNWRGDKLEKDYTNDTLDAVYAMLWTPTAKQYVTPIGKNTKYDRNPLLREDGRKKVGPLEAWTKRRKNPH